MANNPWGSVAQALYTSLEGDATLVSLTGHSTTDPTKAKIGTAYPEIAKPPKFLAIQLFNMRPLLDNASQLKVFLIDLVSFCGKKPDSIAIIDQVEYLFDNPAGDNAAYYDFSNTTIKVNDTRTIQRLPELYDQKLNKFMHGLRVRAIVDPYNPCP